MEKVSDKSSFFRLYMGGAKGGANGPSSRHDRRFTQVFAALRELLAAPAPPERKRIGFAEE
jgi:hypothetical protein